MGFSKRQFFGAGNKFKNFFLGIGDICDIDIDCDIHDDIYLNIDIDYDIHHGSDIYN